MRVNCRQENPFQRKSWQVKASSLVANKALKSDTVSGLWPVTAPLSSNVRRQAVQSRLPALAVCTQPETVFLRFSPSGKLRFTSSHFPRPHLYFTASAFFHPFHFITAARMPSLLPSTAPSNISVKGTPHKPPFFVAHALRGAPYFKR